MESIFRIHFPSAPLADFVASIVYHKGIASEHTMETLIPDGTSNLILEFTDLEQFTFEGNSLEKKKNYKKAWVSGMHSKPIVISADGNTEMMIIQFKSNGAFPMLHIPLSELNDLVVDADQILPETVYDLREKIGETEDLNLKFGIAESWLYNRLLEKRDEIPEAVITFAVEETKLSPTESNLAELSVKTGYSQKQFISLFKKYVGLTPKQYQRVVRFNNVLSEIESRKGIDWTKLSGDCGFYDQAHFIREFKYF